MQCLEPQAVQHIGAQPNTQQPSRDHAQQPGFGRASRHSIGAQIAQHTPQLPQRFGIRHGRNLALHRHADGANALQRAHLVEQRFGSWKAEGAMAPALPVRNSPQPGKRQIYIVDKPGAAEL